MLGVDIIEVSRIQNAIDRFGVTFLSKVFTDSEMRYCDQYPFTRAEKYAARFAGKEAVAKVIKHGPFFFWRDIEITHDPHGAPIVTLSPRLIAHFPHAIEISLSHCKEYAVGIAMVKKGGLN